MKQEILLLHFLTIKEDDSKSKNKFKLYVKSEE